jgi:hypothetical protein
MIAPILTSTEEEEAAADLIKLCFLGLLEICILSL